jgi:hypothetical protein
MNPPPEHVRQRLARILADGLRRKHPDAVVEVIDTRPLERDTPRERPTVTRDFEPPDDRSGDGGTDE